MGPDHEPGLQKGLHTLMRVGGVNTVLQECFVQLWVRLHAFESYFGIDIIVYLPRL